MTGRRWPVRPTLAGPRQVSPAHGGRQALPQRTRLVRTWLCASTFDPEVATTRHW